MLNTLPVSVTGGLTVFLSSGGDRMTTRISRRIGSIAESATLAVDAKAKALKAAGRPVIGFGAGEPDFPTPGYIVDAAVQACSDPANHRYTPAGGLPALKQAIVDKTRRDSGYEIEASQVLITNGGKQAVYEAFATLLDPGTRCCCRRRTGLPIPRRSGSPAVSRSRCWLMRHRTIWSLSTNSRRR